MNAPDPEAAVAVTFNAALVAVPGTPPAPATCTVTVLLDDMRYRPPVPSRVSTRRLGVMALTPLLGWV